MPDRGVGDRQYDGILGNTVQEAHAAVAGMWDDIDTCPCAQGNSRSKSRLWKTAALIATCYHQDLSVHTISAFIC